MALLDTFPASEHQVWALPVSNSTIKTDNGVEKLGLDLTLCDSEPIHIPGSIQPHGLLLIADAKSLTVVAGAGALENRLDVDWLGKPLDELLLQDAAALLLTIPSPHFREQALRNACSDGNREPHYRNVASRISAKVRNSPWGNFSR